MTGNQWTHKYRYKLSNPIPNGRLGRTLTGTVQVSREYSDDEVLALAKEMFHGSIPKATIVECNLISVMGKP
jgi:hypothetical protein